VNGELAGLQGKNQKAPRIAEKLHDSNILALFMNQTNETTKIETLENENTKTVKEVLNIN